jgi:hypothetical protein
MPLTQREAVQLALLLLSVPLQYLLLGTGRPQTLPQLTHLQDAWFKLESWKFRWLQFVSLIARGKPSGYTSHHYLPSLLLLSMPTEVTVMMVLLSVVLVHIHNKGTGLLATCGLASVLYSSIHPSNGATAQIGLGLHY